MCKHSPFLSPFISTIIMPTYTSTSQSKHVQYTIYTHFLTFSHLYNVQCTYIQNDGISLFSVEKEELCWVLERAVWPH